MNTQTTLTTISADDQTDINELTRRISDYKSGKEDEERFKLYRLTRGVYGQRQLGVQMFRIKLPYGRVTAEQLVRIADVSDKYATGNLHITTRQDIQLHYVKLEDSPLVWTELAEKQVTAREACGNTVRNVTASAEAGIDPLEPFDVSPYADAVAHYFMRNPICQEMGRKIKPAFSSSESDTALTFMHDFGFIPLIREGVRGFRVVVGGGLGAQAMPAQVAFDFLPTDQIIPFMEASLRIFDRYGEREKRHKARLKFLIKNLGLDHFLELVEAERTALSSQSHPIAVESVQFGGPVQYFAPQRVAIKNEELYNQWRRTNTFEQKQPGYYGVYIKVFLGDLSSEKARYLAKIVRKYAADDIRLTINQNILLKFIHEDHLKELYTVLDGFGFADPGYDSIADITACPGTDTCNLGVTNSTGLAGVLEEMLRRDYPDLIEENHIKIKISGCMNACGQHTIGNIGFHGSSIKKDGKVIPAMQVLIGGGVDPSGVATIADKITKVPTKWIPQVVSSLLDHYHEHRMDGEYFNHFYQRMGGRKYFYNIIKPFTDVSQISEQEQMDWGQDHLYQQEIGVGECAGVILDMVGVILKIASEEIP
ncbi:MAG: nitrite/sulfite reductase [Bacteroidota bacterium]